MLRMRTTTWMTALVHQCRPYPREGLTERDNRYEVVCPCENGLASPSTSRHHEGRRSVRQPWHAFVEESIRISKGALGLRWDCNKSRCLYWRPGMHEPSLQSTPPLRTNSMPSLPSLLSLAALPSASPHPVHSSRIMFLRQSPIPFSRPLHYSCHVILSLSSPQSVLVVLVRCQHLPPVLTDPLLVLLISPGRPHSRHCSYSLYMASTNFVLAPIAVDLPFPPTSLSIMTSTCTTHW